MQIEAPTEEHVANLMAWRALALDRMPYYGSMLFSFRVVNAPGLGTFACDAQHRLYIDFESVTPRGPEFCSEALLHECGHLFGDHMVRATDAGVSDDERSDWNIAGDAEINDDLRDAGCAELTKMCVFAEQIGCEDYQTAETYMAELRKKRQARKQQQQAGGNKPQPQNGNKGQAGQPGQSAPGNGSGTGKPYAGCGSGSGGQAAPGELDPNNDLNGTAPAATEAEHERVRISTASAIQDYIAKGRGTVPGGLKTIADHVLAPAKVPWQKTLSAAVRRGVAQKVGNFDNTFSRRHRRTPTMPFGANRIVRAGTFSPIPSVAVVRDTSGSMSDQDLGRVTNEVDAIARKVGIRGKDLRIYDVDAAVAAVRDYKGAKTLTHVSGRGGTDMCVGIEAARAQRPAPSAIVVLTDGWTPWPTERIGIPLIICIIPQSEDADVSEIAAGCPEWAITVVAQD